MSRSLLAAALVVAAVALPFAQDAAPMRVTRDAALFVEQTDFGKALTAAFLKKKVPVVVLTSADKADFTIATTSSATREGQGERVAKVLALGMFAGSGQKFEATATVTNRYGAIVFAHNSKKGNFQSAAENIANELKKHIEQK